MKRKYMELRFQMVIGHVDNPLQKRTMRRQIARLNTLIHAHELAARRAAAIQAVKQMQSTVSTSATGTSTADASVSGTQAVQVGAEAK
jgi:large subunit ribosomal protein L29